MEDIIDAPEDSIGVKAFDCIMDIKSLTGCQVVIPSQMADRVNKRLEEDHCAALYSHIDIDKSTRGLEGYDSYTAYPYLVPKKAHNPKDIVIFIAHDTKMYAVANKDNVLQLTSSEFVEKTKVILDFAKKVKLSFYDEIIAGVFRN